MGATMSQDLEVFLVVYESKAQQKRHQIKHNLQVLESIFSHATSLVARKMMDSIYDFAFEANRPYRMPL